MAIEGSLEMICNGSSTAKRVEMASVKDVPAVLVSDFGMTAIADTTPPITVGTVAALGVWTGTRNGERAEARLWVDIPFEETAIGRAIAAGEIDPLNPGSEE